MKGLSLIITAVLTSVVQSVFVDQAFKIDWLRSQVGDITKDNSVIIGDLLTVYTTSNVLASLNISDGSIVWRKHFPELDDGRIAVVSNAFDATDSYYLALGGYDTLQKKGIVQSWDLYTGALVSESVYDEKVTYVNSVDDKNNLVVGLESKVILLNGFSNKEIWSTSNPNSQLIEHVAGYDDLISLIYLGNKGKHELISYSRNKDNSNVLAQQTVFGNEYEIIASNQQYMIAKQGPSCTVVKIQGNGISRIDSFELENDISCSAIIYKDSRRPDEVSVVLTQPTRIVTRTYLNDDGNSPHIVENNRIKDATLALPVGTDGLITLFNNGTLSKVDLASSSSSWSREESLANVVDGVFVDLPETDTSLSREEILYETKSPLWSAYLRRVTRHMHDLRNVGQYLKSYFTSDYDISRDLLFGFKKHFVVLNSRGNLIALDTIHGDVVWSLDLGQHDALGLIATGSIVSVINKDGIITKVDGISGMVIETIDTHLDSGESIQSIEGQLACTSSEKVILLTGEDSVGTTDNTVLFTFEVESDGIQGYAYSQGKQRQPTWRFEPFGSIVATGQRHIDDISASIGVILPDRSVLYKYLHPNTLAVASIEGDILTVSLIDSVTGRLLHSKVHDEKVDQSQGIQLVYGEHWIVYSYYSLKPTASTKIVVWDLLESSTPNERWSDKPQYSSFDNFPPPFVSSQSFFIDGTITSLAVSRTRFGVSSRDIIASLADGKVVDIPKRILDSRRPLGELTKQEKELGAIQYDSYIPLEGHMVLSHFRQALVSSILTTPASLESTSLVVGFKGLDIFFTRVTPSQPFDILSSNFEKTKLLVTIVALALTVLVLRFRVARKTVNAKWGVGVL